MGIEITYPILVLFSSSILALLALSFASKKISGGFIPALAVISGIMWVALFVNIDKVSGMELNGNVTISENPITIHHMNQTSATTATSLRNGLTVFVGEIVFNDNSALNMKEINQMTVRLGKTGLPSGDFYVGVWNGIQPPTLTNYRFLIGQMKANFTSSTTISDYTFTRNDTKTYFLQRGDTVGIFFNGGSSGNTIDVYHSSSDLFDGGNSIRMTFSSATSVWTSDTLTDMAKRISLVQTNIEERSEPIDFNDGATKIYMVAIGVMFMVMGALQRMDKD